MGKKVYLVGAGPGDPELLTIKAAKILAVADVLLYDALVNPEIFGFCKDDALKICAGKRRDHHLKKQEEIDELIVEYAKKYEVVARLKGGTPFVFGRGCEELRAIKKAGFEPVIISGVSSITGVPESFLIPPTDRAFSDSFRAITAHDIDVFDEIVTVYHPRENIVITMGAHNLKTIVDLLLAKGFPKDLPIAILSNGTKEDAKKIVSTLKEIESKNEAFFQEIRQMTPAILFVGNTVHATGSID